MRKLTVTIEGRTSAELRDTLEMVAHLVGEGHAAGGERGPTGGYSFELSAGDEADALAERLVGLAGELAQLELLPSAPALLVNQLQDLAAILLGYTPHTLAGLRYRTDNLLRDVRMDADLDAGDRIDVERVLQKVLAALPKEGRS